MVGVKELETAIKNTSPTPLADAIADLHVSFQASGDTRYIQFWVQQIKDALLILAVETNFSDLQLQNLSSFFVFDFQFL